MVAVGLAWLKASVCGPRTEIKSVILVQISGLRPTLAVGFNFEERAKLMGCDFLKMFA